MNKIQEYIVQILNQSIHNKKVKLEIKDSIIWKEILEECRHHNIESIVYYGIHSNTLKTIDKDILDSWKKQTFMSNVYQINHIKQVSNILNIFNTKNIPVIVLKGLVIRDLYPKSELRTMGDADILVHEKDIEAVTEILNSLGYEEEGRNAYHIEFGKWNSHIEVHWTLASEDMFNSIDDFNKEIWSSAVEVKIGDSNALSMCDEDLLLYLCMHMAKHFINSGFGIRQVCDVLLLVENRGTFIDWNQFIKKAKKNSVDKFSRCIFYICNKLFDMKIPEQLKELNQIDNEYLDLIIDIIFSSGVHGKKDRVASRAQELAYGKKRENTSFLLSFKNIYFPSIDKLDSTYKYVKRNKFLLPIAWIHRLSNAIFRKDYSFSDKIKLSVYGTGISKRHSELLKWLEL